MTIRDFEECIEFNIKHHIRHAILGLGAPGIGKSQVIRQIGDRFGYKVIDIRLSQMSEVEIGGLIYPNEDKTKTRWLTPEILHDEKRDGEKTILLLDEITSCTKRVQVAAYQLILDRRIGQYTLPEGTFVIALGNREEDDGVYVKMAGPLADRFEIHEIDVDFDAWKTGFATKHGIHPYVLKYLTQRPSALHTQNPESEEMVFATPRSWERVSDILKIDDNVNKTVIRNKIIGNIGEAEALRFLNYCRSKKTEISVTDMLNGATGPTATEEATVLIDALVERLRFLKRFRNAKDLSNAERSTVKAVLEAFFRFPCGEHKILGLKKALGINRAVVKQAFLELDNPAVTELVRSLAAKEKESA